MTPPTHSHDRHGKLIDGTARAGRRFPSDPPAAAKRDAGAFAPRTEFAGGVMAPIADMIATDAAGAPADDAYMDALRERAATRTPNSEPAPVAEARPAEGAEPTDFWDRLANTFPRPVAGQPLAAGSASLPAAPTPRRGAQVRSARTSRQTDHKSPGTRERRWGTRRYLALGGLAAVVCVALVIASSGAAPPARLGSSPGRSLHFALNLPDIAAIPTRAHKTTTSRKRANRKPVRSLKRAARHTPAGSPATHSASPTPVQAAYHTPPPAYTPPRTYPAPAPVSAGPSTPAPAPTARQSRPPPTRTFGQGGVLGPGHGNGTG